MKIENNSIILNNGDRILLPKTGHIKLVTVNENVYCNGKQWINGKRKVTFLSIYHYLI